MESHKRLNDPVLGAMRENQRALTELERRMQLLREKAVGGADIDDKELKELVKFREGLIEDQKLIRGTNI